jgi:tRNA G18 (ribose-2'-O)-methylase SpoU
MAFFEIGIYAPVHTENIGTLWRSAYQLGASGIFTIGKSKRSQASDTLKTIQQIPLRTFPTWKDFLAHRPIGARIIGIEMGGKPLADFSHPSEALYVLGSEASGLPEHVKKDCDFIVTIESLRYASYNVAVTGSLVMYHRQIIYSGQHNLS